MAVTAKVSAKERAAVSAAPTTTTTPKEESTDMAKRPATTAKKAWEFKIQVADEVPVPVRSGAHMRLPIDFDGMAATLAKGKGAPFLFIPQEFWVEGRGIAKDKATPAANKDRLRRTFYTWQGDKDDRKKLVLAFSDQYEGQTYTGTNMYLTHKQG